MIKSDILEGISCLMEWKFEGEWKHEVCILGSSSRHLNFEIDGKEYVLVLNEVKEGHNFSEYLDGETECSGKWEHVGSRKVIVLEDALDQFNAFGTVHRNYEVLRCPKCNKRTIVDSDILYEYCPHCGAKIESEEEEL